MEPRLDTATADSIAAQILTRSEQRLLTELDGDLADFVTRVFSAKEAIFKGLYPYVRSYFGFDAVSLTKVENGQLHFVLNQDLHDTYRRGQSLKLLSLDESGQILSLLLD
ncbi:4'-phosphopantetheinyl transferase family protein [Nitrincola sp. MINF-07-Sa-05]|uniref:4'-phosphopantetheinyl transferase family protein n=1 Tax=Nitrincola salilacus TaxID=3400273 RepID=UPI0039183430